MGAALPLLMQAAGRGAESEARTQSEVRTRAIAYVYACNLAGAATGASLCGYYLLAHVGSDVATQLAATIDMVVGGAAIWLGRREPDPPGASASSGSQSIPGSKAATASVRMAGDASGRRRLRPLVLASVGGAVFLGFEVVWMRLLTLVFGHDVHAFSSLLTVALLGLAIGATAFRLARRRAAAFPARRRPGDVATGAALLFTASTIALVLFAIVTRQRSTAVFSLGSRWIEATTSHFNVLIDQLVFVAILVGLPAIASGALLPALIATYRCGASSAERSGEILGANTLGSLAGAVLTGPLLIAPFGISGAALCLSGLGTTAAFMAWPPRLDRLSARVLMALTIALAGVLTPRTLQQVLMFKIGERHLVARHYHESATGTIAVTDNRINGERQLFINGINEVTTRLVHDQSFSLLGHLGLLLHRKPKAVGVVCLGGGLSAGAVSTHPDVESIDIVDLQPEVSRATRYFSDLNSNVLDDPRVRIIEDDGRSHLMTHAGRYDVLAIDSTHPRAADSWMLYTQEFYEISRDALRGQGVLVQWVPLHGMTVDEWRIIVNTFRSVFSDASLWINVGFEPYGQSGYALLVSQSDVDIAAIRHDLRTPSVYRDLERWGLAGLAEILECYVAGPAELRQWTSGLPVSRDAMPYTERLTRFANGPLMTASRLLEVRAPCGAQPHPLDWSRNRAQALLLAGELQAACELCPQCAKCPLFRDAYGQGTHYYRALRGYYYDDPNRALEISAGFLEHNLPSEALGHLQQIASRTPSASIWVHVGLMHATQHDERQAESAFHAALRLNPDHALAQLNLGLSWARQRRFDEAIQLLRRLASDNPDIASFHAALGWTFLQRGGQADLAERSLRRALAINPRNRDAALSLGRLLLLQGRLSAAVPRLETAAHFHRFDVDVLFTLATAYHRQDRTHDALRLLRRAAQVRPGDLDVAALLQLLEGNAR